MTPRKPVRWYVESWAKHSTRWYAKRGPFKARALAVASRVRLRAEEPDKRHIITRSPKHVPDGTPSQAAEVRRLRRALRAIRDPRVVWGLPEARSIADAALRGRRGR